MFRLCAYLLLPLFCQAQPTLQPLPSSLPCQYGVIGLRVEPAGPDTLRVSRLMPGSPAFAAGLRPGDLLLGALPYRLHTREELARLVQSRAPGDSILLVLQRQGQFLALSCRVTDRRQLFSSMAAPEALSRLTMARTVTPLVIIESAILAIWLESPCAFWIS